MTWQRAAGLGLRSQSDPNAGTFPVPAGPSEAPSKANKPPHLGAKKGL